MLTKKAATFAKKNLKVVMLKMLQGQRSLSYTGKCKGEAHNICNLKCEIPKEISIVFCDGSNFWYYFTIKGLVEEFKGQFQCLREKQKNIHSLFRTDQKRN